MEIDGGDGWGHIRWKVLGTYRTYQIFTGSRRKKIHIVNSGVVTYFKFYVFSISTSARILRAISECSQCQKSKKNWLQVTMEDYKGRWSTTKNLGNIRSSVRCKCCSLINIPRSMTSFGFEPPKLRRAARRGLQSVKKCKKCKV